MSTYNSIVVGTDGSPTSLRAVQRAADIAQGFGATLIIGCAYYGTAQDIAPGHPENAPVVGHEQAQQRLDQSRNALPEDLGFTLKLVAAEGSPVAALISIVHQNDGDLLVVGNRGMNSLTGRLLGSVPADLARQSDCDVIIVRTED